MAELNCRHFSGYKPCALNEVCDQQQCTHYRSVQQRLLIVHLGALGAVLRSTSLLKALRRKYQGAHITWVTKAPAHHLLKNLSAIDRILTLDQEDLLALRALEFDVAFVIDKSLSAVGVLQLTKVHEVKGFTAVSGVIVPANREADELWRLGLSNQQKFFVNQKTEQQLVHEALDLGEYTRDPYQINLSHSEQALAKVRRQQWSRDGHAVIGINTGSSPVLPAKKLSVEGQRHLIQQLMADPRFKNQSIVLLGGPEDSERNRQIGAGLPVIQSPTDQGLRDGIASVAACDLIITGDSLGMHMAIALKKWTVAWFGPTCPQEIDLYGRGRKILAQVGCSPCWKRVCQKEVMCYDQVNFAQLIDALAEGLQWHTSSSKLHFQEISS
jgi:heptosyltransferase-2